MGRRLHSRPGHTCYNWKKAGDSSPPQRMVGRNQTHRSCYTYVQTLAAYLVHIPPHPNTAQYHDLFHRDLQKCYTNDCTATSKSHKSIWGLRATMLTYSTCFHKDENVMNFKVRSIIVAPHGPKANNWTDVYLQMKLFANCRLAVFVMVISYPYILCIRP